MDHLGIFNAEMQRPDDQGEDEDEDEGEVELGPEDVKDFDEYSEMMARVIRKAILVDATEMSATLACNALADAIAHVTLAFKLPAIVDEDPGRHTRLIQQVAKTINAAVRRELKAILQKS